MKTISAPAMAAIEAGEAIVTGAVEIIPNVATIVLSDWGSSWEYQTTTIATSPPAIPGGGWSGPSPAPFGGWNVGTLPSRLVPIATSWVHSTGLWIKRSIACSGDTDVTIYGNIENSCYIFFDGVQVGSHNAGNSDVVGVPSWSVTVPASTATAGSHVVAIYATDDTVHAADTYLSVRIIQLEYDPDTIRVWGGYGDLEIDGDVYKGIGDRGLAQQTAGAVGGVAQGMVLSLSGVEPEVIAMLDAGELKGAPVVVRRLIFASDGKTLLDAHVFDRGRIDTIDTEEVIGGSATIKLGVETAARGLGRSLARQRSDSDQRLINPDDGYFRNTAYAGEKMLYWGGKTPARAGSVLRIGNTGSGG